MSIKLATAGLLHLQDGKLLLAYSRNKQAWYLPGGKIDAEESSEEALCREILEELNVSLHRDKLRYYAHIQAKAFGEVPERTMEQDCYLYEEAMEIAPSNEIEAVRYFSREDYALEPKQVVGVKMIMDQLQQDDLLM